MKFWFFNTRALVAVCLCWVVSCFGVASTYANSNQASLIASMEQRLPALMELKLGGKVGETNMGLVEGRVVLEREERRLIADENRDRLANYKIIAEELGIPVAAVQRKRAEQIRNNSPRGVWIESKNGDWYRE